MTYGKVTMIGAGFMSASLAIELRERRLAQITCVLARDTVRADELLKLGLFDQVTADFNEAVTGADVIILATPVRAMESYIIMLEAYLNAHPDVTTLVTDVGSTKAEVVEWVVLHGPRRLCRCFAGSHPLCGSEKQGAAYAAPGLYDRSMCVIVPLPSAAADSFVTDRISLFWQSVGCRTSIVSAVEHDRILAYTSHVPHVLAFAFAGCVDQGYLPYTAGSFRDLTRLSRSSPDVWTDIFSTNRDQVLSALESFESSLRELKHQIERSSSQTGREDLCAYIRQIVQLMEGHNGNSD